MALVTCNNQNGCRESDDGGEIHGFEREFIDWEWFKCRPNIDESIDWTIEKGFITLWSVTLLDYFKGQLSLMKEVIDLPILAVQLKTWIQDLK